MDGKFVLNYDKMKEIKVSKLRLCFTVYNSDFSIYENSEAVLVDYDRLPMDSWNASTNSVPVYENGAFKINAGPYETDNISNGFKASLSLISKNDDPEDMEIFMRSCKLFDKKGNEISEDDYIVVYSSVLPGYSLSSSTLTVKVKSDTVKPDDLGELNMTAVIVPRGTKELEDAETLSFTVPFNK